MAVVNAQTKRWAYVRGWMDRSNSSFQSVAAARARGMSMAAIRKQSTKIMEPGTVTMSVATAPEARMMVAAKRPLPFSRLMASERALGNCH